MARLFSSGFELNTVNNHVEWDQGFDSTGTIQSSVVLSGTYALQINNLQSTLSQGLDHQFTINTGGAGPYFFRVYFRIDTLPTAQNMILGDAQGNSWITIDNLGKLRLFKSASIIGSPSSALSTGIWYRIEVQYDSSGGGGAQILNAKIDGTQFAGSSTLSNMGNIAEFEIGGNLLNEAQTIGNWYFDDIAINDNTGSFQNSYPGSGKIIHLKPNAAGDINGYLVQVGGTAGSSNNFTRVNEVPPDDATSYNASAVLNAEDLFNVDASGIGAADMVNVVAIGGRFADLVGADATSGIKFEVIKTSGGTKAQSGNTVPNTTNWSTNSSVQPQNYPLTTYQDPDSSNWTQTTLDSMQIGYTLDAVGLRSVAISTIWALVDYTPAIIAGGLSAPSNAASLLLQNNENNK